MRRAITTKSGYRTNIDRYSVLLDGKKSLSTWGVTKARAWAHERTRERAGLWGYKGSIELLNEYTGEITRIQ